MAKKFTLQISEKELLSLIRIVERAYYFEITEKNSDKLKEYKCVKNGLKKNNLNILIYTEL